MKVAYLINSNKYSYHKELVKDFLQIIPGDVEDLANWNYTIVDAIADRNYDLVIMFDLVGHEYRTTSETLSFNKLKCRVANIIFRRISEYSYAHYRQNLSSFMYISKRDALDMIREKFDEVPNIDYFEDIQYKASSVEEHNKNVECIKCWWDKFKKEAMLV